MRVLRNSGWIFTSTGVVAVLSFFYLAILARSLGPEGFGLFAMIMATTRLMAAFLRFETWQTIVKFGVPHLLEDNREKFSSVVMRCLRLEIAGGLLAAAAIYFIMQAVGANFGWPPELISTATVMAVAIMLCPRSSARGILRVHDRFRDGALADSMIPIGRMIGALAVLAIGPKLEYFLIVWALAEILSTIVYWMMVFRNAPLDAAGMTKQKVAVLASQTTGFWNFFFNTNLVNFVASMREHLVVIIVGFFVGAAPAGLFRLANQLANSLVRLSDIFARPLFTELSRIYAGGDRPAFIRLFLRSLRMSTFSGIAVIILLVLLGKPILMLMAGEEFAGAYPLLVLLGTATAVGLIGLGLDPLLQAAGRPHISTAIRVAALAATLAGLALFLQTYGVMAAAASVFGGAVITILLSLAFGIRLIKAMR